MAIFNRRRRERTIYFPWERRGISRALALPRRRFTVWILISVAVMLLAWIIVRDRRRRNERVTRAVIERTRVAIDAYRADHPGRCPASLMELTAAAPDHRAYLTALPLDAWKRPLRFSCPSREATRPYDLLSDGPDGEPYGLDRIE
jgi:hypothetical protein